MLHVVDLHPARCALQQDGACVLGERNGADEDHQRDEGAGRGVRVEARLGGGLPDDDGGDDDADVVDGVADHVDEDPEHAEVSTGFLELGRVVAVLRVGTDGLLSLWLTYRYWFRRGDGWALVRRERARGFGG